MTSNLTPVRLRRLRVHRRGPHAVFLILCAVALTGGQWHTAGKGECSDCHSNHNSSGGSPMRYDNVADPAQYMLRRETAQLLCVSCHDGSNAAAPDVVGPVSYVADPAGGFFANSGGVSSPMSHDVGMGVPVIPPGGTIPVDLDCVTCHDPHGNANYRNLRPDPTSTGLPPVAVTVNETVLANGSNPSSVYVQSNLVDKSGMSAWCNQCHASDPGAGSLSGHPTDRTIWGAVFADYAYWSGPIANRVRVENPADNAVPSTDDRVFCLSCHKAHGSANNFMTIYADGMTLDSTCQECHNV
jgi:predicted CXXCH cytochrome family protein